MERPETNPTTMPSAKPTSVGISPEDYADFKSRSEKVAAEMVGLRDLIDKNDREQITVFAEMQNALSEANATLKNNDASGIRISVKKAEEKYAELLMLIENAAKPTPSEEPAIALKKSEDRPHEITETLGDTPPRETEGSATLPPVGEEEIVVAARQTEETEEKEGWEKISAKESGHGTQMLIRDTQDAARPQQKKTVSPAQEVEYKKETALASLTMTPRLRNELNELFGSKGIMGFKKVTGIESLVWKIFKEKTVKEVSEATGAETLARQHGLGDTNGIADVGKLKGWIFEMLQSSSVKPESEDETIETYAKRVFHTIDNIGE